MTTLLMIKADHRNGEAVEESVVLQENEGNKEKRIAATEGRNMVRETFHKEMSQSYGHFRKTS